MTDQIIAKGYKQTEVGVIPDDWAVVQLGNIGKVIQGLTYSPKNIDKNGILVLRSSNIQNRTLSFKNNVFVNTEEIGFNPVKENDILICVRNGSKNLIGKNSLIDKDNEGVAFGAFMSVFRSNDNMYLFQLFNTDFYKKQVYQNLGATINSINNNDLKRFKIPLPPKPEQQKIADILTTWDEAIEKQTALIQQKQQLKKGLMQQLLTGKTRFSEFSDDWQTVKLGDISNITTGRLNANAMVKNGKYKYFTCAKKTFEIDKYAFNTEALLISGNGANVGYIHYYNGKFNAYQRTYVLDKFFNYILFIKYILDANLKKKIFLEKKDGNIPYIVMETLSSMRLQLPSIEEQQKIAQVLSLTDDEITQLQNELALLKTQKKGLMQQLLTGKIRVDIQGE